MIKEIFIWGIARSGNHALTEFIAAHNYKNIPSEFLNNNSLKQSTNFRKLRVILNNYLSDRRYDRVIKLYKYPPFDKRLPLTDPLHGNLQIISHEDAGDERQMNFYYKEYINILEDSSKVKVDTGRNDVRKYAFIVLRDPFNWFASYKKAIIDIDHGPCNEEFSSERKRYMIELWISYAKKFFVHSGDDWFAMNYNEFCSSKEYRKLLSEYIDEDFTDEGINNVSSMGSSFSRYKFDGKASQMNTNERWKHLTREDKNLLREYPEIFELSKEIFNFMPKEISRWI